MRTGVKARSPPVKARFLRQTPQHRHEDSRLLFWVGFADTGISMKVLILSVTAGQGHNSTAKALSDYLSSKGADVRVLDTVRYINRFLGKTVDKGYLFVSSKVKLAYKSFYRLAELRHKASENSPSALTLSLLSMKLEKYISSYDPDVIICTHVFAGIIVDILKNKAKIRAHSIGILTDFAFHPYWEESDALDYVVVPNENLLYGALQKGYVKEQVLPFGIPINPKFEHTRDKKSAREALGLDPDRLTFLLMGGSMGYGNIAETLGSLDRIESDFQIICVCGNNSKAKEHIDTLEFSKRVLNLGFVDYVDLLMDASDCIVTKPGGLTTSESMAKGLPMIIVNPIPGQEDRNTEFLLNNGAAMAVSPTLPLEEIVWTLCNNPQRLALMKESIKLFAHPDSTRRICDFAVELCKSDYFEPKPAGSDRT